MSKKNYRSNKSVKKKKRKKRIRKRRLILVILAIVLFIVAFFNLTKSVTWVAQSLKNIDKKDELPIENLNEQKQYNLNEEVNQKLGKKYTVLIDPGHGGNDKGTQSQDGKILEKDVSLILAKRVANKLSKQDDVQVLISRTDDKYMSLEDRAVLANTEKVDLLVSIHLNAEGGGNSATGVETYYKRGATDGSDKLADSVQKSINSYIDVRDRGTREDMFQVLRDSHMPSILIECGFLTNSKEAKNLLTEEYQEGLTEGIAQGILSYLDSMEK